MDLEARKYEFTQKLFAVNESLFEQLESVLNQGTKEPQRISLEQYNKKIDEAIEDVEKGNFYTQDEARKIENEW
ncbi:addiction module protein [Mariniflexile sp.]|uniref:addiction module protein n=1 Tax=Mariniflexile sp. TaxID=1979402 RepID=UPI0040479CF0